MDKTLRDLINEILDTPLYMLSLYFIGTGILYFFGLWLSSMFRERSSPEDKAAAKAFARAVLADSERNNASQIIKM
jgi:hypothetical protein